MRELTPAEEKRLERKRRADERTLVKYEKQLRNQRKEYGQYAQSYALTGRKNRAGAVGECVLKLLENLRKLNGEKKLLNGTLFWTVDEVHLKDTNGRKGYQYTVTWRVKSEEAAFTDEQIREEITKTEELIRRETDEMFGLAEGEEQGDHEGRDGEVRGIL